MGYVKIPVAIGESLYLPLDRAIRSKHGIEKECLVDFTINDVKPLPPPLPTENKEEKAEGES